MLLNEIYLSLYKYYMSLQKAFSGHKSQYFIKIDFILFISINEV